jgi:cytochrome oxidase Cu insertion factor (SCO1/SenC/PrrC family)
MKPAKATLLSLSFVAFVVILATTEFAVALEVGQKAPDFTLESTKGGKLALSSLKGKNVLINFYVLDFSPT